MRIDFVNKIKVDNNSFQCEHSLKVSHKSTPLRDQCLFTRKCTAYSTYTAIAKNYLKKSCKTWCQNHQQSDVFRIETLQQS